MKSKLYLWLYPITVFITGACVLIVEVVAVRMLAPYFGNTIYTFSSVISVILLALSAGYYYGGQLADKHPKPKLYFSIVSISGITLAMLYALSKPLLPAISDAMSLSYGPLVSTTILFLVPALLIGFLSPFAVRLQADQAPKKGVGTVSGRISFFSTAGSIVGSLLAGFVLIPQLGIHTIFVSVAIVLIGLGLFGLTMVGSEKDLQNKILIIGALALGFQFLGRPTLATSIVYQKDGVYERLQVSEGTYHDRPTRFFMQDRSNSSAMYLDSDDPKDLVFDYSHYYRMVELFQPNVQRALTLGGGVYSIPKAMLAQYPQAQVEAVEIEGRLEDIAKEYFALPTDDRLSLHTEDGRRYLKTSAHEYDLIFSDVYSSLYSLPSHFTTKEFFELASTKLTPDGVFLANIIGDLARTPDSLVLTLLHTAQAAFDQVYLIAVVSPTEIKTQNFVLVGTNSDTRLNPKAAALLSHDSKWVRDVPKQLVDLDRFNLATTKTLTDDYAPIDALSAAMLRRSFDGEHRSSGDLVADMTNQQLSYGDIFNDTDARKRLERFIAAEMRQYPGEFSVTEGKDKEFIVRLNQTESERTAIAVNYAAASQTSTSATASTVQQRASSISALLELLRLNADSKRGIDFVLGGGDAVKPELPSAIISLYQKSKKPKLVLSIGSICHASSTLYAAGDSPATVDSFKDAAGAAVDEDYLSTAVFDDDRKYPSGFEKVSLLSVSDSLIAGEQTGRRSSGHCSETGMSDAVAALQAFIKKQ